MKNRLKCVLIAMVLVISNMCTSFAAVYIPNTDLQVEEITTNMVPSTLTRAANASGSWNHDNTGWWWVYPDGSYAKNKWEFIDNYWYYFNNNGYMAVGWVYINSVWYYLNPGHITGIPYGAMATGWQNINSPNYSKSFDYYFDENGKMKDSPSELFRAFAIDYGVGDKSSISIVQSMTSVLKNNGCEGTQSFNNKASDVLKPRTTVAPNSKTNLNTGLFISFGHGEAGIMEYDGQTYLTGKYSGSKFVSIRSNSMNNVKIALFLGCKTAIIDSTYGNLLHQAITEGALGAFGFNTDIGKNSSAMFCPELVLRLALGSTLTEAAASAASKVPSYDACRNYYIEGGNTRYVISDNIHSQSNYSVPNDGEYKLYKNYNGNKIYVKIINGIMTSDYYVVNSEGDVIDTRNKIDASEIQAEVATTSNINKYAEVLTFNEISDDTLDVYEMIDGQVRLVRITQNEMSGGMTNELIIHVTDLETGEEIPYSKILDGYN